MLKISSSNIIFDSVCVKSNFAPSANFKNRFYVPIVSKTTIYFIQTRISNRKSYIYVFLIRYPKKLKVVSNNYKQKREFVIHVSNEQFLDKLTNKLTI